MRNERNIARDEIKQLKINLEASLKESNSFKREKNDLELQILRLKKEMEKIHNCLMNHAGQFSNLTENDEQFSSDLKNVNSEDGLVTKTKTFSEPDDVKDLEIEEYVLQGTASPKDLDNEDKVLNGRENSSEDDYLTQKVKMLQLRLDDMQKTLFSEKEYYYNSKKFIFSKNLLKSFYCSREKNQLLKSLDKMSQNIDDYQEKCEGMRKAKQEAIRELLTLQETHRAELRIINNSLQEEMNGREMLERKISEMRGELERLQSDNSAEWAKRERLETEKINLERENKKIKSDLIESQVVERRGARPLSSTDCELRTLQQELIDRNKVYI